MGGKGIRGATELRIGNAHGSSKLRARRATGRSAEGDGTHPPDRSRVARHQSQECDFVSRTGRIRQVRGGSAKSGAAGVIRRLTFTPVKKLDGETSYRRDAVPMRNWVRDDDRLWHIPDNRRVAIICPVLDEKRTKVGLELSTVCPLMTHKRHWLCTAVTVLIQVSAPIKVLA